MSVSALFTAAIPSLFSGTWNQTTNYAVIHLLRFTIFGARLHCTAKSSGIYLTLDTPA